MTTEHKVKRLSIYNGSLQFNVRPIFYGRFLRNQGAVKATDREISNPELNISACISVFIAYFKNINNAMNRNRSPTYFTGVIIITINIIILRFLIHNYQKQKRAHCNDRWISSRTQYFLSTKMIGSNEEAPRTNYSRSNQYIEPKICK